jgi:proteasome accessory factor B
MPADSPLVRQWVLLQLLCARRYGMSVRELAEETGVTEKAIRRSLAMFRAAGMPLEHRIEAYGRKIWRIRLPSLRPELRFTMDEAVALYLARRLLEPLAGTYVWDAARRALAKIRSVLGRSVCNYAEQWVAAFHPIETPIHDYAAKAELIDRLVQAVEERRVVSLTYCSVRSTEATTYAVHPYGLAYHRGALYLIGHAPRHSAIRHWKADRIEAAELTSLRFFRPATFNLREHFRGCFGIFAGQADLCVRIRFAPTVARYIQEAIWHRSQQLTACSDGSLLGEFRVCGTEEIKSWVLSFGRHAEVMEPASLREELADELQSMLRQYASQLATAE